MNTYRGIVITRICAAAAKAVRSRVSGRLLLHSGENDMRLLLNWLLSAISLLIVAHVVPGFHLRGFMAALIAALVIGLVNATLGVVLKIITFPLAFLTLGLFWLVINALMLLFASAILSPAFVVAGFWPAFWGAIVLALVNMVLRALVRDLERD